MVLSAAGRAKFRGEPFATALSRFTRFPVSTPGPATSRFLLLPCVVVVVVDVVVVVAVLVVVEPVFVVVDAVTPSTVVV